MDSGCGSGAYWQRLSKAFKGENFIVLDVNKTAKFAIF